MSLKFDPIINYGCLAFIFLSMTNHKMVNNLYLDFCNKMGIKNEKIKESETTKVNYTSIVFFMIPIIILMYFDYTLGGDNWENQTIILNVVPVRLYNYILRIAGAYGLVQVLAQDLGVKTGLNQRNFIQNPLVLFIVLFGSAYSFTGFRGEAMFGTFIYMLMKLNSSFNVLSGVCFEDV